MLESLLNLWPESLTTQALLVGILVGFIIYYIRGSRHKLPPGPRGWPVIGNLLGLREGNMFKTLEQWSKQYGPVMTINLGMSKFVVLSNKDVVLEALVKRQADFAGRAYSYAFDKFTDGGKDIVAANYGPTWKLHRKLVSKAIRNYLVGEGLNNKLTETLNITTKLMKEEKGPFDPYPYLSLCVFNVLNGMVFNKVSPNTKDKNFQTVLGAFAVFNEEIGNGFLEDMIPPLRLCPTPGFRRIYKVNRRLIGVITEEVNHHRDTFSTDNIRDLTDAIILAQQEAVKEEDPNLLSQITNTHVVQTVSDVFFAGIDTSRNTLHWTLLAMCLYPEVQRKVQDEVDSVIGEDLSVDHQTVRDHLPYTEAVLCESMRIRDVVPTGVPHVTLCDTAVGGFTLPKGTNVMINHHAVHFDPDQWEQPSKFRPERFLDASGKMASKPESWLPFSAGRRVCLGETIAKPELHLLFAGIMRAVSVSLAPGETRSFEPTPGVTNLPRKYKVVVKPRF